MKQSMFRFALIGALNTLIDLGVYTFLRHEHVGIVLANMCSTTAALTFSFAFNRRYTFQAHGDKLHQQIARFVPVTLIGLWVVTPALIYGFTALNNHVHYLEFIARALPESIPVVILGPKILAISGSLTWNFLWYSKFVFKENPKNDTETTEKSQP